MFASKTLWSQQRKSGSWNEANSTSFFHRQRLPDTTTSAWHIQHWYKFASTQMLKTRAKGPCSAMSTGSTLSSKSQTTSSNSVLPTTSSFKFNWWCLHADGIPWLWTQGHRRSSSLCQAAWACCFRVLGWPLRLARRCKESEISIWRIGICVCCCENYLCAQNVISHQGILSSPPSESADSALNPNITVHLRAEFVECMYDVAGAHFM